MSKLDWVICVGVVVAVILSALILTKVDRKSENYSSTTSCDPNNLNNLPPNTWVLGSIFGGGFFVRATPPATFTNNVANFEWVNSPKPSNVSVKILSGDITKDDSGKINFFGQDGTWTRGDGDSAPKSLITIKTDTFSYGIMSSENYKGYAQGWNSMLKFNTFC